MSDEDFLNRMQNVADGRMRCSRPGQDLPAIPEPHFQRLLAIARCCLVFERQCADLTRERDAARSEAAEARNKALEEAAKIAEFRSQQAGARVQQFPRGTVERAAWLMASGANAGASAAIHALRTNTTRETDEEFLDRVAQGRHTPDPEREAHEPGQQRTAREAGSGADDGRIE